MEAFFIAFRFWSTAVCLSIFVLFAKNRRVVVIERLFS